MSKTSSDILLEAATLLEEDGRWLQGTYFKTTYRGCSMCAHGAIAYCGNPDVRNDIQTSFIDEGALKASQSASASGSAELYAHRARVAGLTLEQWIASQFGGEVGIAHFKAAQVGLDFAYNDNYETTKQDVINKLREAALT